MPDKLTESISPANRRLLTPDNLLARVAAVSRSALQSGALRSIPTQAETCQDGSFRFLLRQLGQADARDKAVTLTADGSAPKTRPNPFLPYEPELYVGHLSDDYLCLLNKFNVIPQHFLIVTATFQLQMNPLTEADFAAAAQVLEATPGLIFYNSGRMAGASQQHKHLQVIPYPLLSRQSELPDSSGNPIAPIEDRLASLPPSAVQIPEFRFIHRFCFLDPSQSPFPIYQRWIEELNLRPSPESGSRQQPKADLSTQNAAPGAYNLLLTRDWMLLVPRCREKVDGLSVNALGFAGTLLARNRTQLEGFRRAGPLKLLQQVACGDVNRQTQ